MFRTRHVDRDIISAAGGREFIPDDVIAVGRGIPMNYSGDNGALPYYPATPTPLPNHPPQSNYGLGNPPEFVIDTTTIITLIMYTAEILENCTSLVMFR